MYLSGSHSLAPDVFELGEACQDMEPAAKLAAARPLDAGASGAGMGEGAILGRVDCWRWWRCTGRAAGKDSGGAASNGCHPQPHLPLPTAQNSQKASLTKLPTLLTQPFLQRA